MLGTAAPLIFHILVQAVLVVRVLLRPHRDPASRMAWIVVILALPVIGALGYLLLGEVRLGRRRIRGGPRALPPADPGAADLPATWAALFAVGTSAGGLPPVAGNRGRLLADARATIEALVADIDAASDHVHVMFYIWLPDRSGTAVAAALERAARRGVVCRAMVDDLGSRALIRSPLWACMRAAGVRLGRALPIGNPLLRILEGRIDVRNHRKIVVVDDRITYCGSRNCADPEFAPKPRYAPWVDTMMRFEGPVARQNQRLFAEDWTAYEGEDLSELVARAPPPVGPGFVAQAIGTGPEVRFSALPEIFVTLMYAARSELVVTTPYYVPDDAMQSALCACARRGIATRLVLPARNDSRFVAAASRSYYPALLAARVEIHEFEDGLLHAKTLTLDGAITLIGSANMDRRSFELNYENEILLADAALTGDLRRRQQEFIARSRRVTEAEVAAWSLPRRLWMNAAAMLGPVL